MLSEFLKMFKKPTAAALAQSELEGAQRALLMAQSGLDFARSSVDYNHERVARLTRYVRTGQYDAGTPAVPPLYSDTIGRPDIASTTPDARCAKLEAAAKLALEALEVATTPLATDRQEVLEAITALRQAGVQ